MRRDLGARKWWALGALALSLLAIGLDATVLNLALPTLAKALGASSDELQWFVAAYTLVLAAGMLPAGVLGDRFGRKVLLVAALVAFGVGSIASAYAGTPAAFTAARALMGLGAAFAVVMTLSVITVLFDEAERPRAIGIWAAANFLAMPVGPLLGGWILTNVWWGWVFLINVPVTLLGVVAVLAFVPESRSSERTSLDPLGMLASAAGMSLLTYGFIDAGELSWSDATALRSIAAGLALLAMLVLWERRLARAGGQPLVDLELFGSRGFASGTVLAALTILAMFGGLFAIPQYFQAVVGLDPQATGLWLLPMILGLVAGAVPADRIAARAGPRVVVAAGLLILGASAAVGSTTVAGEADATTAGWICGMGLGMGLALATAASAALVEITPEKGGVASGLMQTVQKVAAPFGVAILGSILNEGYRSGLQGTALPASAAAAAQKSVFAGLAVAQQLRSSAFAEAVRGAFVIGMDHVLLASAVLAVLAAAASLAFMPRRAVRSESRTIAA
ncbi:MAG: MFS transporter [Chloroflexota bacterium]|nr:MFS transporter [Chloroflexota bacterium]